MRRRWSTGQWAREHPELVEAIRAVSKGNPTVEQRKVVVDWLRERIDRAMAEMYPEDFRRFGR